MDDPFVFLPVEDLTDGEITLRLREKVPGDAAEGRVPAYKFDILRANGERVGACNLRIGHTMRLFFGGNIGYTIEEAYRGHHCAAKACKLLFRLAARHDMKYVYITCSPQNAASSRTCQLAGCTLVCTVPLPEDTDMYRRGDREVMVYRMEVGL